MPENILVQLVDDCYNCFNDRATKIGMGNERERVARENQKSILNYVIVHEDKRATTIDQLMMTPPPAVNNEESERLALAIQKQKDRHRLFKRRFLANLARIGLLMETVCGYRSSCASRSHTSSITLSLTRMFERVKEDSSISSNFTFPGL